MNDPIKKVLLEKYAEKYKSISSNKILFKIKHLLEISGYPNNMYDWVQIYNSLININHNIDIINSVSYQNLSIKLIDTNYIEINNSESFLIPPKLSFFRNLKVLDIYNCPYILNVSTNQYLQKLLIKDCYKLVTIDLNETIKDVVLINLPSLILPEYLFTNTDLNKLILNNIKSINILSNQIYNNINLNGLSLINLSLKSLDLNIINLINLKYLELISLQDFRFNDIVFELKNLIILKINYINIPNLPLRNNIINNNLKILNLKHNNLTQLFPNIHILTNLQELNLEDNKLSYLPDNIGNLPNLTQLIIDKNNLISLPDSIGQLNNLKTLSVNDNNNLKSFPESLKLLSNLYTLEFLNTKIIKIPKLIYNMNLRKIGITLSKKQPKHIIVGNNKLFYENNYFL